MSPLAKAIDDLLAFVRDERPPRFFDLRGELLQRFYELDRAVWVGACVANWESHLPERPADRRRALGKTNLPGSVIPGAFRAHGIRHWRSDLFALRALADAVTEAQAAQKLEQGAGTSADPTRHRRKRGRPVDTNLKTDKHIYDVWQKGKYRIYEELASELNMTKGKVATAIDRQRKRLERDAS
jgi:hypothetical protein